MEYERSGDELLTEGQTRFDDEKERNDEPEPRVQVLTPSERNAYRGVTIDEGAPDGEMGANVRFERGGSSWKSFSYMTSGSSWQGKLTLILGVTALLLFIFFIALPVAFTLILLSVVSWILYRLFS